MKAITYQPTCDQFQLSDIPVPTAFENQALIKVITCGLNPVDTKIPNWQHLVENMDSHFVVGLDVVGEIVDISSQNTPWQVGDKVLFHGNMFDPNGGLAEYCLQDHRTLTRLPKVSDDFAASTPCAGWTAWRALVDKLRVQTKRSLLIAGGAGGVGGFAIQLARYFGVKTIIATCSEKNADYVRQLGATHIIDYQNQDVVAEVMAITASQGVDIALDCVGAQSELYCANSLKFDGEMVELVETADLNRYLQAKARGVTVHQLSLGAGYNHGSAGRDSIRRAGESFNKLLEQGDLTPPKITTIPLEEAASALMEIRNQRTVGKILVDVSGQNRTSC
ncbi:zinc-binding dehydrogenase [Vibrio maritimus]